MRPQVVVLGPIEREMYVRLAGDLLPAGTKRAEELSWRIVGCGVEVSERLSRLGLSVAVVTGIGASNEDRELLSALRKRGVHTRGARSGARATPVTVRVRTPRHEVRMTTAASASIPSTRAVLRALPGSRHFHVCGSFPSDAGALETISRALAHARHSGASTSLDVSRLSPRSDWNRLRGSLANVDVLFARSETLRTLVDRPRIGAAASEALRHGVSAVAVGLASGGTRVYSGGDAIRIPSLGDEVEHAGSAFAAGYLLGWLLGSTPEICGVLGGTATLESVKAKLPDRRELALRLTEARKNPALGKLVSVLGQAQRVLDKARRLPRRDLASNG